MERLDNLPKLDDEFADRYCELQQELAQLRERSPVPSGPDEKTLGELKELRDKLRVEQQQHAAFEQSIREWRDKYESAAARLNELHAEMKSKEELAGKLQEQISRLQLTVGQNPLPAPVAGASDFEDLRRQLTDALDEKSRWKRLYDACRDELNGNS